MQLKIICLILETLIDLTDVVFVKCMNHSIEVGTDVTSNRR